MLNGDALTQEVQLKLLFFFCPDAARFWQDSFGNKEAVPFLEFHNAMVARFGGNVNKCLGFHSFFLKGVIQEWFLDHDTKQCVTYLSFRLALTKMIVEARQEKLETILMNYLQKLITMGEDFESPGRKLYLRAKSVFIKAQEDPSKLDFKLIAEAKKLFEEYAEWIKADVPLLRPRGEDRHLFYLCEIEDLQRGEQARNWAISELAGRWNAWQKKFGTKTPKQKIASLAREHFATGEACYLKALILHKKERALQMPKVAQESMDSLGIPCVLTSIIMNYWDIGSFVRAVIKAALRSLWITKMSIIFDYLCDSNEKQDVDPLGFSLTPIHSWEIPDVANWLTEMGLGTYIQTFEDMDINGGMLLSLTDEELQSELGINSSLHRKKIFRYISQFQPKLTSEQEIAEEDIDVLFDTAERELKSYEKFIQDPKVTRVDGGKLDEYLLDISYYAIERRMLRERMVSNKLISP